MAGSFFGDNSGASSFYATAGGGIPGVESIPEPNGETMASGELTVTEPTSDGTLNLPEAPVDATEVEIYNRGPNKVTVSPQGSDVVDAPVEFGAGQGQKFVYQSTGTKWQTDNPGFRSAEITYDILAAAVSAGNYFRNGEYCDVTTGLSAGTDGPVFAQRNLGGFSSQGWNEGTIVYGDITDIFPDFPLAAGGSGAPIIMVTRTDMYTTATNIDEVVTGAGIVQYNGSGSQSGAVGAWVRPFTSGTQMRVIMPLGGTGASGGTLSGFTDPSAMSVWGWTMNTMRSDGSNTQFSTRTSLCGNRSTGATQSGGNNFAGGLNFMDPAYSWKWAVCIGQNTVTDFGSTRNIEARYYVGWAPAPTPYGMWL
jgi:hypothetical protein